MRDIRELIPQRPPMLLVDELTEASADSSTTTYRVREDAALVSNGMLSEAGIIEHMAQSASALAGFLAVENGATEPPLGMIGEVRNFKLAKQPAVGESLTTKVVMGLSVNGVTNVGIETRNEGELVATCELKIVIRQ